MTDPVFGRATPVHFIMLNFACWACSPNDDQWARQFWPPLDHAQKIKQIIQGRANLFYLTEQDFGVNLSDWRDFFVSRAAAKEEDFGYGHAYAGHYVDRAIQDMIAQPDRLDLEKEADAAQANIQPEPEYWWPGERNK